MCGLDPQSSPICPWKKSAHISETLSCSQHWSVSLVLSWWCSSLSLSNSSGLLSLCVSWAPRLSCSTEMLHTIHFPHFHLTVIYFVIYYKYETLMSQIFTATNQPLMFGPICSKSQWFHKITRTSLWNLFHGDGGCDNQKYRPVWQKYDKVMWVFLHVVINNNQLQRSNCDLSWIWQLWSSSCCFQWSSPVCTVCEVQMCFLAVIPEGYFRSFVVWQVRTCGWTSNISVKPVYTSCVHLSPNSNTLQSVVWNHNQAQQRICLKWHTNLQHPGQKIPTF